MVAYKVVDVYTLPIKHVVIWGFCESGSIEGPIKTKLLCGMSNSGWLKEMRTLCDLVKNLPNELKAVPKEGVGIGLEPRALFLTVTT